MVRRFHVIQGGKGQNRRPKKAPIQLFRAYSIGNVTRKDTVYNDVKFNWYCLERNNSAYPYEKLIAGYRHMNERDRAVFRRDADRYFTAEEIEALRLYLGEQYSLSIVTEEVSLPITERSFLFEEGSSVVYDFIELSEREDYTLPIKVWGYYTLQHCLTSPSMENGVRFLRSAFELLGMSVAYSKSQLETVAKMIFEKEGLLVGERKESA